MCMHMKIESFVIFFQEKNLEVPNHSKISHEVEYDLAFCSYLN